jgi:ABC-type Fe3+/spermidine/putrescine transport system ATPase subunit
VSRVALRNVTKQFGGVTAVDELTIEVEHGEFFSILGPSGCGKTTVLRMIAGFETPTSGSIHIGGVDVTGWHPKKVGVGMVFQNYALFPHMTVFENVAFGLDAKGVGKGETQKRVERILHAVNLMERINTSVTLLSGGEQQRVALARALVVEPPVLLLDEPLSNLDPSLRTRTREELRELQHRLKFTAIYVTHDQGEAMSLSDRIAIMRGGRLLQVGSPAELYHHPASAFVAEFLGGANLIRGDLNRSNRIFSAGPFEITIPQSLSLPASDCVLLAIKPESISIVSDFAVADCSGRIVEHEFLGFMTKWRVDVGGVTIDLSSFDPEVSERLNDGSTVGLRIDWSRCSVFACGTGE